MNVSLYQAASALDANTRWQEVIAGNLAASNIPGYKKQDLSFSAVQAGMMPKGISGTQQPFTLQQVKTTTNFAQGELHATLVKTDLALDGPGFFVVQLPNGSMGYTRDGEFQINGQGELTTKQGMLVQGESGPIRLNLTNGAPVTISTNGEINQAGESRGKLKVVDFQQPQLLTPTGGGLFIAQNPGLIPNEVTQGTTVRQGFLEGANTSSVMEMANLLTDMRGFETNQKVIQLQDDRMAKAISELGSPS